MNFRRTLQLGVKGVPPGSLALKTGRGICTIRHTVCTCTNDQILKLKPDWQMVHTIIQT